MSTIGSSETWPRSSRPRRSESILEVQESPSRGAPFRWLGLVLLLVLFTGSLLWVLWSEEGLVSAVSDLARAAGGQWRAVLAEDPRWFQLSLALALSTPLLLSAGLLLTRVEPMLLARTERNRAAARYSSEEHSRRRYFQGIPHPLRPLPLTAAMAEAEAARENGETGPARSRLISLRGAVLEGRDRHRDWLGEYTDAETERLAGWKTRALRRVGGIACAQPARPAQSGQKTMADAGSAIRSLNLQLRRMETTLAARLITGHRLLARAAAGNRRPELAPAASEMGSLLELAAVYERGFPQLEILRRRVAVQRVLAAEKDCALSQEALATAPGIHQCLKEIREQWHEAPSPIAVPGYVGQGKVVVPLGPYLVPRLPEASDAPELFAAADQALARGFDVGHRIWGRLARLAELAESVVGLDPLAPGE